MPEAALRAEAPFGSWDRPSDGPAAGTFSFRAPLHVYCGLGEHTACAYPQCCVCWCHRVT